VDSVAVGDVNGDGRLDIVASCRTSGRVRVYLNGEGGTFTLGDTPVVTTPRDLKLADTDGDGDRDIIVARDYPSSTAIFLNDGFGHFGGERGFEHALFSRLLDVFDWDQDGDPDIAVSGSTSTVTTLLNTTVGCPAEAAITVGGQSVAEGASDSAPLPFSVTLSTPVPWTVTVAYATMDGTASSLGDYAPATGTLTFSPGETQKTVAVVVHGDTAVEPDETFWLRLSNASGAPLAVAQATGTITNDDAATVAVLTPIADTYVQDGGSAALNFGGATTLEVRAGPSHKRWTFLRFDLGAIPDVEAATLRLYGSMSATTPTPVQTRVFSSRNLTWDERALAWNNKPVVGTEILASAPLMNDSTTSRWYTWDLTEFLQAEKAAGRNVVTLVLRNDVAAPRVVFHSREAARRGPELRIVH
jgi:hypothetical protein